MTPADHSPTTPKPPTVKTWPETDDEREAFASWQHVVGDGDTLRGFRDYLEHEFEGMNPADDQDPNTSAPVLTAPLDQPLSLAGLRAAVDDDNDVITALVYAPESDDLEDQLDQISEAITGTPIGLTAINVENERVEDGTLILKVTAMVMFDTIDCDDSCLPHDPDCDGYCDHGGHVNACTITAR